MQTHDDDTMPRNQNVSLALALQYAPKRRCSRDVEATVRIFLADSHKHWVKALEYAATVFGRGNVRSNIVAGIESKDSILEGIEYLASKGLICYAGASGPFHDAFRISAGESVGDQLPQYKHPVCGGSVAAKR